MILFAQGAYGREADRNDWLAGKDFVVSSQYCGPYFSIRDLKTLREGGYTEIQFLCRKGWIKFAEKLK
jgi:hypothetical protein